MYSSLCEKLVEKRFLLDSVFLSASVRQYKLKGAVLGEWFYAELSDPEEEGNTKTVTTWRKQVDYSGFSGKIKVAMAE